jgi:hypothetical protein
LIRKKLETSLSGSGIKLAFVVTQDDNAFRVGRLELLVAV